MTRTSSGKALFVSYGGGHIAMVIPVIKALERLGIQSDVMALTTAHVKAVQAGLRPLGYRDFLHLVDRDAALAHGQRLMEGNQHPDVDPLESCAYLGINFLEWVDAHGLQGAQALLEQNGRRGFLPLRFMGRVIDELQPAVVVTTNSPRSEQAAIEAAVERGIPSLSMVDLFALDYDPYLRRKVHADRITVLADAVKSKLVAAGIAPQSIRVTGNPAFDALMVPQHREQALALRKRLGWAQHTVVLWAGHLESGPDTPAEWRDEKFGLLVEATLRDWVDRRPDAALIVRYHPNEFPQFPWLGDHPRVHLSHPGVEPVHTALLAADAAVVQTTTVGVEAAVAGLNVFALSFSPFVRSSGLDYSTLGLAHGVPSLDALVPMLDQYASTPASPEGRFNAGKSAQSVAAEIAALSTALRREDPRTAASRA